MAFRLGRLTARWSRRRRWNHERRGSSRTLDRFGTKMPFQNPSQAEQNDFLIRLYFGQREPLTACVDRAYLDFSRTLHGMAHLADAASVPRKGGEFVSSWPTHFRNPRAAWDLDSFDAHHRNACERLCELYAAHGFDCFV